MGSFRHTKWKTKDGQVLRIREMTSEHLRNATKFMERKIEQRAWEELNSIACFSGEMAQYYAEQHEDHLFERLSDINGFLYENSQSYRSMQKERALRDKQLSNYKPKS